MKRVLTLFIILLVLNHFNFIYSKADELRRGVAESGDDGQESSEEPYAVDISFTYIELMWQLERWGGATRFPNITIPQGATIDSAHIWQWSYGSVYRFPYDSIACEDVDSATIIIGGPEGNANISNRWNNRTTAWVLWQEAMQVYKPDSTPAVTDLVQEIVDRPGWKSGNAIMFLYKNCYEAGVDSARHELFTWDYIEGVQGPHLYGCSLHVEYTPAPAVSRKYLRIRK